MRSDVTGATRLRFGLPSKGRLQQQTASFLAAAGIDLKKSSVDREYAGELVGVDGIDLVFLQAGEMPERLLRGEIHLGVTGEDLIRERAAAWKTRIALLAPLDFGHADLIVAVPKCWIDVTTTDDLDDVAADFRERHGRPLRVATKYGRLTRAFFRERGVANYRIVDSQGATEGLVASHDAEAIVDITSSGETLKANHLKVLDDGLILKSEAHLCASLSAPWGPGQRETLRALLDRIGVAAQEGGAPVVIAGEISSEGLTRAEPGLQRLGAVLGARPSPGLRGTVRLTAPAASAATAVDLLAAAGAEKLVSGVADASAPPLFEAFARRLDAPGD